MNKEIQDLLNSKDELRANRLKEIEDFKRQLSQVIISEIPGAIKTALEDGLNTIDELVVYDDLGFRRPRFNPDDFYTKWFPFPALKPKPYTTPFYVAEWLKSSGLDHQFKKGEGRGYVFLRIHLY